MSSSNQSWGTPPLYVAAVRRVFGGTIDLDPCSNEFSVVGASMEYKLPEGDGLRLPWDAPHIFVNPPYGADRTRGTTILDWLARCKTANLQHHSEVIALVPVATNTRHWKQCVWGVATGVAFLYDTRLKFLVEGVPSKRGAPMACAMIYWGDNPDGFQREFTSFGAVVRL